jgi:hypothetical protein
MAILYYYYINHQDFKYPSPQKTQPHTQNTNKNNEKLNPVGSKPVVSICEYGNTILLLLY